MSDYSEHLISMAGGDGDTCPSECAANYHPGAEHEDVPTLLTLVRTQQATLDRVLNLANTSGRCGWRISADELRKTLRGES